MLPQQRQQRSHAIVPAHQGEHPLAPAEGQQNGILPAVEGDHFHILIGFSEFCTQVYQAADARMNRHVPAVQFFQQLFGAAEKAHIPGHDHRKPAQFRMLLHTFPNGGRRNGRAAQCAGVLHRFQHSFCTDEALCLLQNLLHLGGLQAAASRPDAHNVHPGLGNKAEFPAQHPHRLVQIHARLLGWTTDNHSGQPQRPGGFQLFREAPRHAGSFGHQNAGTHCFQHGNVHFR